MVKYKDIIWHSYHGALLPKAAPHIEVKLTKKEEKELLKLSKTYFLRYISNWDMKKESEFWYVIKDEEENLSNYKSKLRNQIKKGLNNCIVHKVSSKEIALNGYECYENAMKNYTTDLNIISKDDFYSNKINLSGIYDFFAIYEKTNNKMIGWSSNKLSDNSVDYTEIKFDPKYLKHYPSYALFYEMNQYYINKQKKLYVNDGARNISHDTNIQDFLIQKFKFRKAYCKLNIFYRWDIGLIVKLLYPFRTLFYKSDNKIFNKLSVLLKQEYIRRECASL